MTINRETMQTELRTSIPNFVIDPEWAGDNLTYLIIGDLVRYLCEQAQLSNWDILRQGLGFLERSLEGKDSEMRDLVHEALESFLSCASVSEIKNCFGPQTLALWNEFMEPVYQTILRDKDLR
ncbi:MAG: DUF7674 family protein [Candidatus Angelobacter sp.]|jgi:hypothetical protein